VYLHAPAPPSLQARKEFDDGDDSVAATAGDAALEGAIGFGDEGGEWRGLKLNIQLNIALASGLSVLVLRHPQILMCLYACTWLSYAVLHAVLCARALFNGFSHGCSRR
jgi:hypothetical protein